MAYSVVDLDDLEGEGRAGMVRKVRRALGARAFGFNCFTVPPGTEGREHDHVGEGLEEVYFVVRGGGVMRLGGAEFELQPGRFLRGDPETTRMPVAEADGLAFVTLGAPLEGGYEPPAWG